jgi:hypothetical protein
VYVNTIFVPDSEPTSFVSTYDTMYFILYCSCLLFCIYMFLLTCSVSNILLFYVFMECLNKIQYNARNLTPISFQYKRSVVTAALASRLSVFVTTNRQRSCSITAGCNTLDLNPTGNKQNYVTQHSQGRRSSTVCHQQEKSWLQPFEIRKVLFMSTSCLSEQ